jgi:hypothetical protein
MEEGYRYKFGELKAGDKFAYQGAEYEKISGNFADILGKEECVEIPEDAIVYLFERG